MTHLFELRLWVRVAEQRLQYIEQLLTGDEAVLVLVVDAEGNCRGCGEGGSEGTGSKGKLGWPASRKGAPRPPRRTMTRSLNYAC